MRMEESGIARLINKMMNNDTGTISAFRGEFSRKENLQRNVSLKANLLKKGYSVTLTDGGYIENYGTSNATPVYESTFFVEDISETGNLLADLLSLGEQYNQDSIMYIPKGGEVARLYGTKNSEEAYFPYHQYVEYKTLNVGYKRVVYDSDYTDEEGNEHHKNEPVEGYNRPDPEFFTLKANKPFFFTEDTRIKTEIREKGVSSFGAVRALASMNWREIPESMFYKVIIVERTDLKPNKFVESSKTNGFWVKGSKIYDITTGFHAGFIIDNPDLFGLSKEDIVSSYKKNKEKFGQEGKTREELIKMVAQDGWIRVRHYIKPRDYWSIQCDNTKLRKSSIHDFLYWAIKNEFMTYYDEVVLLGYNDADDREYYSFQSGGVQEYLMNEAKKNFSNKKTLEDLLKDYKY